MSLDQIIVLYDKLHLKKRQKYEHYHYFCKKINLRLFYNFTLGTFEQSIHGRKRLQVCNT